MPSAWATAAIRFADTPASNRIVMRPNRQRRYLHGKSDSLDAESAALSVLNGQATASTKSQTGSSEMIRHLKIARDSAVKAKS